MGLDVIGHAWIRLEEKPCIVKYLEECDNFLVGTYEQLDTYEDAKSKFTDLSEKHDILARKCSLNDRFGSFVVISNSTGHSTVKQFDRINYTTCFVGGGVFDFVTLYKGRGEYRIYAAHSNGKLGIYAYLDNGLIEFQEAKQIGDSTMLTCIDICDTIPSSNEQQSLETRVVVGDSDGHVSILDETGEIVSSVNIAKDLSVWQVKFIPYGKCHGELILVTIDDSTWFIYQLKDNGLQMIFKSSRRDFESGVTSVTFVNPLSQSNNLQSKSTYVLIGSYDSQIKLYSITINEQDLRLESVRDIASTRIPEGGIWRIRCLKSEDNTSFKLFVTAMYAKSVVTFLNFKQATPNQESNSSITEIELGHQTELSWNELQNSESPSQHIEHPPLHYGVDVSNLSAYHRQTCCTTDFNNNLVHFFIVSIE